ncbi:hypothetical protein TNCV_1676511 [Trichonephila clavipes]|nr:hypothetical protein TNCV_1676511 [Trichonephila clavipes]
MLPAHQVIETGSELSASYVSMSPCVITLTEEEKAYSYFQQIELLEEINLISALAVHTGYLIRQCAMTFGEKPYSLRCIATNPHNLQELQQNISDEIAAIPTVQL